MTRTLRKLPWRLRLHVEAVVTRCVTDRHRLYQRLYLCRLSNGRANEILDCNDQKNASAMIV
jgi:hypothetical protein